MTSYTPNAPLKTPTSLEPAQAALPRPSTARRVTMLGLMSFVLAITALTMALIGDPYWLSAPYALLALLLAQIAMARSTASLAMAELGNALSMLAIMLWLIIDLVLPYVIGIEYSLLSVFESFFTK